MSQQRKRADEFDTSGRDGPVRWHDPTRTFAQNVASYLRHQEGYVEGGGRLPTGMMLFGTAAHPSGFRLVGVGIVSLFQFETATTEQLFARLPSDADRLYSAPMASMPKTDAAVEAAIAAFLEHNDVGRTLHYLHVNGWWVNRPACDIDGPPATEIARQLDSSSTHSPPSCTRSSGSRSGETPLEGSSARST